MWSRTLLTSSVLISTVSQSDHNSDQALMKLMKSPGLNQVNIQSRSYLKCRPSSTMEEI